MDSTLEKQRSTRRSLLDFDTKKPNYVFRPMSPSRFLEARSGTPFLAPLQISQGGAPTAPVTSASSTVGQLTSNSTTTTSGGSSGSVASSSSSLTSSSSSATSSSTASSNPAGGASQGADATTLGKSKIPCQPTPNKERVDAMLDAVAQLYYRRRNVDSVGAGDKWSSQEYDLYDYPTLHLLLTPLRQPSVLDYWTPSEIVLFEAGMCSIGKDFHLLHKLIPSKTPNQLVDFYYAWKRSSHYAVWKSFDKPTRKFHMGRFEQWERLDSAIQGLVGPVSQQPDKRHPEAAGSGSLAGAAAAAAAAAGEREGSSADSNSSSAMAFPGSVKGGRLSATAAATESMESKAGSSVDAGFMGVPPPTMRPKRKSVAGANGPTSAAAVETQQSQIQERAQEATTGDASKSDDADKTVKRRRGR